MPYFYPKYDNLQTANVIKKFWCAMIINGYIFSATQSYLIQNNGKTCFKAVSIAT